MRGHNGAGPFFSNEAGPEFSPQVSYETVWPDGQKKRNIRADYGKKKTSSQNKTGENVVMRPKRKEKTNQTGMAIARYTDHEQ